MAGAAAGAAVRAVLEAEGRKGATGERDVHFDRDRYYADRTNLALLSGDDIFRRPHMYVLELMVQMVIDITKPNQLIFIYFYIFR